jgi:hypothetical protein
MIDIQFPGGRTIRIDTEDPQVASSAARKVLEREYPEEYAAWEQSRPLPGFFQGIVGGARQGLGGQLSGLGAQLGERGLPGEQTLRSAGEAVSGQADPGVRQFTGISDFGRELMARPGSAIPSAVGQAIGALAGSAALPLAAVGGTALAGASAPVVGAAGLTAAIASGALGSTNELEQLLIKEGVDPQRARSLGANPGALIGAVEGGLGGYALSRLLGRQIRGAAAEELVKVAQRSASRQAAREAGTSGALEAGSEALGGAARQAIAAAETGNANIAQRLDDVALDALMGAIGGGGAGAIAGSRAPGQAMERLGGMQMGPNPPAPGTAPPPAEPPAPTFIGPQAPPLPEAPAPVTTFEEAIEAIRARPELAPQITNVQPEDVVNTVNALQQYLYGQDTAQTRSDHISNWLGYQNIQVDPATEEVMGRATQAAQVIPQIYEAVRDGRLSLEEGFQPADIANIATEPYGGDPTSREIGAVREALDTFVSEGYLMKLPGGTYTLAPRDVAAQRQRQADLQLQREQQTEAQRREVEQRQSAVANRAAEQETAATEFPGLTQLATQTQEQQAAQEVVDLVSTQAGTNPTDFAEAIATAARPLPSPFQEQALALTANVERTSQLLSEERILRESRTTPENTDRLQAIEEELRTLGRERAVAADLFQGIAQGTARINTAAEVTPTTDVGRTNKTFPGDMTPDNAVQILRNAKNLQQRAQAAQDEKLLSLFDWMLEGEKGNLSTDRWKSLFKNKVDLDIDTPTAENAVRVAREAGITNGMNTIVAPIAAPTQLAPKPAPAPKAAKPTTEAKPAPKPKAKTPAEMTAAERTAALAKALAEDEAPAPKPTKKAKAKPKLAAVPTTGGTRSAEEVAAAQAAFTQVVGQNGRLTFEERLDVDNLAADVQQAAQESGISGDISGYAQGDLAVLSLANSDMPLDQVAIHEGQHVAENMGLYTPNEISILNANADKIRSVIKARLPYISDVNALPLPEVRAYGLNARVAQKADFGPLLNRIFDKFAQFTQRLGNLVRGRGFQSWQDVYDRFLGGEMGKRTAVTPDGAAVFFAAPAPATPNNKYLDNQITGLRKFFASPIMTISKERPAIRPAGDNMQQMQMRRQESTVDFADRLDINTKLTAPQRAAVTRAWAESSRLRKLSPQATALSPELRKVFDANVATGQQAFNYLQESMVIDKFMPNEGQPAAQRTKLEALWARHSEKHLWQIPKAELQAASPEGYREMQAIEQKRNPFYLPMLANGTHFIAAYKKDAKGNRVGPPVKMAIYTPTNMFQRMRGFGDAEQTARQNITNALKAQGLDPAKYYVMDSGVQLTQNEEAYGIRQQGDFIANYLKDLHQLPAFQTPGAAREKLAQVSRKLDKDMADRIFRQNEDILVAVTPENEADYILDMLPTYLLGVSNIQARRYTQESWVRATKGLSPADVKYLNDLRDYSSSPNVAFSTLRTLTFFNLLGGAFDSAVLNGLQVFQTTVPMLTRDGGLLASRYIGPAGIQVFAKAQSMFKSGKSFGEALQEVAKNADERDAIAKAARFEVFAPLYTTESRGQATAAAMGKVFKNGRVAADRVNMVAKWLAFPQQFFEQGNRATTFLAAYRLAVDNPDVIKRSNKYDNRQLVTPYDYAVAKVADTQYTTTKEDRALYQRFTPAAEVATQFMSYTTKTMENYVRHMTMVLNGLKAQDLDLAKAGAIGVVGQALPLIALAGVWALPGADFLKELVEKLTASLWGSVQNFDADLNRALGGGFEGAAWTRGIPHAGGFTAISNRMKIDPLPFNDLTSMSVLSLLGPSGAFVENQVRAAQFLGAGDYVNAAALLLPRFAGNVVRGVDFAATGEIRSAKGETILSGQQSEQLDRSQPHIAALMGLGFQTPQVVNLREAFARNKEIDTQTQKATASMNRELAGYLTDSMEAMRRGDTEESQRQINRLRERIAHFARRNQEFIAEGRPDLMLNLNFGNIQRRAQLDYFGRTSPEAMQRMGNPAERLRMREEYDLRMGR